ncbi:hypothetical protein ARMGADRAFT_1022997 [Armillaria gallica]|uniref:CxC2-like cysteine cluster KDZ transposase-associated domain-containing protein n=1 Tax=Armillaria gallica TaxID=47427 RepID=A0A2H3E233_ARMGA|nr:hypothetical protein ARMGADRAFT_1022997 [Armillaria gallica]
MSSPLLCQAIIHGFQGAPRGRGSGRGSHIGRGRGHGTFWGSNSIKVYQQNQHSNWVPFSTRSRKSGILTPWKRFDITEYSITPHHAPTACHRHISMPEPQERVPDSWTPKTTRLLYNVDSDQLADMQEMSDMLMEDMIHLTCPHHKRNLEDEPLPKWTKQIDIRTGTDHCDTCGKDDGGSYHCTLWCLYGQGACIAPIPSHPVLIIAKEQTGSFYRWTTLKDLGLIVQLGHAIGDSCLHPADNSRLMVIIDIDGIHKVSVNFCRCHCAKAQYIQLLRTCWFPATADLPCTAVTFRALNHFQMLTFMSKVSAYEYYHTLSRLMDNTGVHPPLWHPRYHQGSYVNCLFLGVDANFRLVWLNVSSDICDPGLNHGFAYFMEESAFQSHLAQFHDKLPTEMNMCNNHNAIKLASLHGKGTATSGVDLHKGEDYLHIDYVVLKTLQQGTPDQTCGVGQTDSKAPEWMWASSNLVASSTKEMAPGLWRNMLDDHFNDHNWRKVTTIVVMLLRCIKDAVPEHASTWDTFEGLCNCLSADNPTTIAKWTKEVKNWENGQITENPFEPHVKAMSMASEERDQPSLSADFSMLPSASEMIREGLTLERSQHDLLHDHNQLGTHSTDLQQAKIIKCCNQLRRNIKNWIDIQCVYIPQVQHEWDLQVAGAEEALDEVWRKIILEMYVQDYRKEYGHGQCQGTRTAKLIGDCSAAKNRSIAAYRHAHKAMASLVPCLSQAGWRNVYQCLSNDDMHAVLTNQVEGEGRQKLSWIWMAPGLSNCSSPEHVQDEQAEKLLPGTVGGAHAYALQQVALHMEMHDHCVHSWHEIVPVYKHSIVSVYKYSSYTAQVESTTQSGDKTIEYSWKYN